MILRPLWQWGSGEAAAPPDPPSTGAPGWSHAVRLQGVAIKRQNYVVVEPGHSEYPRGK